LFVKENIIELNKDEIIDIVVIRPSDAEVQDADGPYINKLTSC